MFSSLFVNLPVADVAKSVEFFDKLGFSFNEQFTDAETACLIVSENISVMLSNREKFGKFIDKEIAAPGTTEMLLSFACESPDMVRELSQKAVELGARRVNDPEDAGFMFSWGFEDLDGHLWDLFWMNPAAMPGS